MSTCRQCHHARDTHEHFRRGSDCAACDCTKFKATALDAVMTLLHRDRSVAPVAVSVDGAHAPAA